MNHPIVPQSFPHTPLWLALHLPLLPLEANAPLPSPSAIVEQGRILLADAVARQAGVESGSGMAAARMLAPAITLMLRNLSREEAAMNALACWAGCLTPRISVTPDSLLLEVGSCLRLFGGVEKLVDVVQAGVQAQGFSVELAAAPTPLGAQWLAQRATAARCPDMPSLRQHLEALPIDVLPVKSAASLASFGVRTLADLRRLPGTALSRRIGRETMQLLARAFGELPDPRADFVFPERFSMSLPLPAAVENAGALLFAARRLTSALAGWLAVRQGGVRELVLHLLHRQGDTPLALRFSAPTSDEARFERVLRERLGRLSLTAPVESLCLQASHVTDLPGRSLALFDDGGNAQEAVGALLERLEARLGGQQVYRLGVQDDHRPECATRRIALFEKAAPDEPSVFPRPLWLLDKPEALAEVDGRPYRQGVLTLLAGPERIESGWWDGGETGNKASSEFTGDIRRDYFIAISANACWLWIYRECRAPGGWFLQGYFS